MRKVTCNACAGEFLPEIQTERRGVLEYQFFSCPYCNAPYLISVTDEELRREIQAYISVGERIRGGDSSRETLDEGTELLRRNVRRAGILKSLHPMEAE